MENEKLRLDILSILYSIRNGEKHLSYKNLKYRLGHVEDNQLIIELFTLSRLKLINVQNGLTRFLEGSDSFGVMSISAEGEEYFKKSLEWKKKLQLAKPLIT